jgi:hypothetical protein
MPYRNPVEVNKIQGCIIKALQIQQEVCPETDPQAELQPCMWIITPILAAHKLESFGALASQAKWGKGIYLLNKSLQMDIIVVHQYFMQNIVLSLVPDSFPWQKF